MGKCNAVSNQTTPKTCAQAFNEGHDLAHESNEIIVKITNEELN